MRQSMVVNPPTDRHLAWAAQVGVSDLVVPYPGDAPGALAATCRRAAAFGLACTHGGAPNDTPGYEMAGRLFAAGYLRGLIQAA